MVTINQIEFLVEYKYIIAGTNSSRFYHKNLITMGFKAYRN